MSDVVPPGTDDEWLDQLRDAVGSVAEEPEDEPSPAAVSDREGGAPALAGVAGVRDAVRSLAKRMGALESTVDEIARVVRRAGSGPGAGDLEVMITRVLQAELPALLEEHRASVPPPAIGVEVGDETLDRWVERAGDGSSAASDVVLLAHELRARVAQIEELQRQAFTQLTADRQALIDDAVREIRTMLFGQ